MTTNTADSNHEHQNSINCQPTIITSFNDEELATLRQTWYEVTRTQSDSFGARLFLRLFELHPAYLPLFGFPETTDVVGDQSFRSCSKLAAHGANVLYMLTMTFDHIDDAELVDAMLVRLVHSHVRRGIEPTAFDHIVRPFDEVAVGCGRFTSTELTTLRKAFAYVKERIQALYEDVEARELFDGDDDSSSGTASDTASEFGALI